MNARFCKQCGGDVVDTGQRSVVQCWDCGLNQNDPLTPPAVEWVRQRAGRWVGHAAGYRISVYKAVDAWGWTVYRLDKDGWVRNSVAGHGRSWDSFPVQKRRATGALALVLASHPRPVIEGVSPAS